MSGKLPASEKIVEEATREKDKRKAIIAAAREIFSQQGYEATTIAEIAARAGVAVGTVYLHFHNKREVYVATSMSWNDEIAMLLSKPEIMMLPIEHALHLIVETTFAIFQTNYKFKHLFQIDVQNQEEINQRQKSEQKVIDAIDALLQNWLTQGNFAAFDTSMYAKIFFDMNFSIIYDCFCMHDGSNQTLYQERVIELVGRILYGPPLFRQK